MSLKYGLGGFTTNIGDLKIHLHVLVGEIVSDVVERGVNDPPKEF